MFGARFNLVMDLKFLELGTTRTQVMVNVFGIPLSIDFYILELVVMVRYMVIHIKRYESF